MRMAKMNNKVKKWFRLSIMAICTGIGMVQLIYAIIWAFQNGNNVQDFFDSSIYISGALKMKSDGWRLLGYSCFLFPFKMSEGILKENYVIPVYCVQAVISLLCYAKGCKTIAEVLLKKQGRKMLHMMKIYQRCQLWV